MEKIVLGSGKIYVLAYTDEIPADEVIEVDGNLLGLIQGGASLEYTPTFYEAKDDLGLVSKKILNRRSGYVKEWNNDLERFNIRQAIVYCNNYKHCNRTQTRNRWYW